MVGNGVGESVGGVGDAVIQCPLSKSHAALAQGRSHTALACNIGGHPTAQSNF
jgi:hypothetical protein